MRSDHATLDLKDDAILISMDLAKAGYVLKSYSHFYDGGCATETAVYVNKSGDEISKKWLDGLICLPND